MTAIVSLLTEIPVRNDVAMTGEITLRGRVLPVGGIKEKVLAAHRAGIKHVILPERNMADVEEVPQEVRDELEFHPVQKMEEVLRFALTAPEKLKLGGGEKEKKKSGKSASAQPAG
jgi:ATP-dependent Lon protease